MPLHRDRLDTVWGSVLPLTLFLLIEFTTHSALAAPCPQTSLGYFTEYKGVGLALDESQILQQSSASKTSCAQQCIDFGLQCNSFQVASTVCQLQSTSAATNVLIPAGTRNSISYFHRDVHECGFTDAPTAQPTSVPTVTPSLRPTPMDTLSIVTGTIYHRGDPTLSVTVTFTTSFTSPYIRVQSNLPDGTLLGSTEISAHHSSSGSATIEVLMAPPSSETWGNDIIVVALLGPNADFSLPFASVTASITTQIVDAPTTISPSAPPNIASMTLCTTLTPAHTCTSSGVIARVAGGIQNTNDCRAFCETGTAFSGCCQYTETVKVCTAYEYSLRQAIPEDSTFSTSIYATTCYDVSTGTTAPMTALPTTVSPVSTAPTSSPTLYPTNNPTTPNPTPSPTFEPTFKPTPNPTLSPTRNPTMSPTPEPTFKPTPNPTQIPTMSPVFDPTEAPTTETPSYASATLTSKPSLEQPAFPKQIQIASYPRQIVIGGQYSAFINYTAGSPADLFIFLRAHSTVSSGNPRVSQFLMTVPEAPKSRILSVAVQLTDTPTYTDDLAMCARLSPVGEHLDLDVIYGQICTDFDINLVTDSPTHAPGRSTITSPVTSSPTPYPTALPVTSSPTQTPTASPMTSSTQNPTVSPVTSSPTQDPSNSLVSLSPTPSQVPTKFPTRSHTISPIFSPTVVPTTLPTLAFYTLTPTHVPATDFPTTHPTSAPTTLLSTCGPCLYGSVGPCYHPTSRLCIPFGTNGVCLEQTVNCGWYNEYTTSLSPTTASPVSSTTPVSNTVTTCTDMFSNWVDSHGDSCAVYTSARYCENGGYGANWGDNGNSFSAFAVNGHHAGTVCCSCGGGQLATATQTPANPSTSPIFDACQQICQNVTKSFVCVGTNNVYESECHAACEGHAQWSDGMCATRPACSSCKIEYAPVCSSHGLQYMNKCWASCTSDDPWVGGTCAENAQWSRPTQCDYCTALFQPVCGVNKKTYPNFCHAGCSMQHPWSLGVCKELTQIFSTLEAPTTTALVETTSRSMHNVSKENLESGNGTHTSATVLIIVVILTSIFIIALGILLIFKVNNIHNQAELNAKLGSQQIKKEKKRRRQAQKLFKRQEVVALAHEGQHHPSSSTQYDNQEQYRPVSPQYRHVQNEPESIYEMASPVPRGVPEVTRTTKSQSYSSQQVQANVQNRHGMVGSMDYPPEILCSPEKLQQPQQRSTGHHQLDGTIYDNVYFPGQSMSPHHGYISPSSILLSPEGAATLSPNALTSPTNLHWRNAPSLSQHNSGSSLNSFGGAGIQNLQGMPTTSTRPAVQPMQTRPLQKRVIQAQSVAPYVIAPEQQVQVVLATQPQLGMAAPQQQVHVQPQPQPQVFVQPQPQVFGQQPHGVMRQPHVSYVQPQSQVWQPAYVADQELQWDTAGGGTQYGYQGRTR